MGQNRVVHKGYVIFLVTDNDEQACYIENGDCDMLGCVPYGDNFDGRLEEAKDSAIAEIKRLSEY